MHAERPARRRHRRQQPAELPDHPVGRAPAVRRARARASSGKFLRSAAVDDLRPRLLRELRLRATSRGSSSRARPSSAPPRSRPTARATRAFDVTLPVATEAGGPHLGDGDGPATATPPSSRSGSSSRSPRPRDPARAGRPFTVTGTDFADPTTMTVGGVAGHRRDRSLNDHQLTATIARAPARHRPTTSSSTTPDGTTGTLRQGLGRGLPRRARQHTSSTPSSRRSSPTASRRRRRRHLRRRPGHAAPADGGLPPEGEARPLLLPPPCTGVFADVPCSLDLRALDRGARRRGHHRRLRRRQLLPARTRSGATRWPSSS